MKQYIIWIEGPSCAGKSTAVRSILKNNKNIFHINKDNIKWFISDYSSNNEEHLNLLRNIILQMTELVLKSKMSILIERQQWLRDVIKLEGRIEKFINIEAPLETLIQRFNARMKEVEETGGKVANTSVKKLEEIYNNYTKNKYKDGITIDTQILNKEEVVNEIENYIFDKTK